MEKYNESLKKEGSVLLSILVNNKKGSASSPLFYSKEEDTEPFPHRSYCLFAVFSISLSTVVATS